MSVRRGIGLESYPVRWQLSDSQALHFQAAIFRGGFTARQVCCLKAVDGAENPVDGLELANRCHPASIFCT